MTKKNQEQRNLESYLKQYTTAAPEKPNPDKQKKLENKMKEARETKTYLLSQIQGMAYDLLLLQKARYTYPGLHTGFMSIPNNIKINDTTITLPRFSVYTPAELEMEISVKIIDYASCPKKIKVSFEQPRRIPRVIANYLIKSIDLFSHADMYDEDKQAYEFSSIDKHLFKKYDRISYRNNSITFSSMFSCFVRKNTQEKLIKAKEIFENENMFIISETRPDEWNKKRVVSEGAFIGVLLDQCFLIDHFKTEPIEQYLTMDYKKIINQEK
jgi:hypothetical protein